MSNIPIRDITLIGIPAGNSLIVFDDGSMKKGTLASAADAVRPVASQSEAQAGVDNAKTMTPLRTKQSISSEIGVSIASKAQGDIANTALQPSSIGASVQAYDADLSQIAALSPSESDVVQRKSGVWTNRSIAQLKADLDFAPATGREILVANRTYYVNTSGSDTNTGLSSSVPLATIQRAYSIISQNLDLSGYTATIQLMDSGSKYAPLRATVPCVGQNGPSGVVLRGNASNKSLTTVAGVAQDAVALSAGGVSCQAMMSVLDIRVETSGGGSGLFCEGGGCSLVWGNIDFGACTDNHISTSHGAFSIQAGGYEISGGAGNHIAVGTNSTCAAHGAAVAISNSPAFTGAFVEATGNGLAYVAGMTFTNPNTVTGNKFLATAGGCVITSGADGVDFLPGSLPGRVLGRGQYNRKSIPGEVNFISAAGATTLSPYDRTVFVDASAGNVTLNLYGISNYEGGNTIEVVRIDGTSNTVTIVPFSGSSIVGANSGANYVIGGAGSVRWRNYGTQWFPTSWFERAATVAEMKATTNLTSVVTPGRMKYHPGVAKGWVNANTSGVIQASYNVSSVIDSGVGILGVNWATAFSSGAYAPWAQGLISPGGSAASTYITHVAVPFTAGALSALCVNASTFVATDPSFWSVAAFGDQA